MANDFQATTVYSVCGLMIGDHVVSHGGGLGNAVMSGVVFGFILVNAVEQVVVRWHGDAYGPHAGTQRTGIVPPDQLVRVGRPE